ncbi:family 20 glycosylhydrolase [Mucilaginibacter sp. SMC90]|uniref:family 20 glycosylhydrolase n=1 Tax=Mucilaginibacter sp. SMC90 TaxID=2929803 RepID=UPI001FB36D09|nr:family 20 glycosylhydrolase [Mucilaginibacter sp. SMC90]UOE47251.1 family 20 glycosylhydrolase [Mucilaginibacter sp. SMC90]
MKISFKLLCCSLFFLAITGISYAQSLNTGKYNIIPYPAVIVPGQGTFTINRQTVLDIGPGAAVFVNEQLFLKQMVGSYLGSGSLAIKKGALQNAIILKYDPSITEPEGYSITVTPNSVTLSAKKPAGMFYAIETLRQLIPAEVEKGRGSKLFVPVVSIQDKPAFAWRGMMLDVSRHFFSVTYLKKYVDLMALYKINKLHLHLTDDQGWRIEIKRYPRLTSESGWRTYDRNDSACIKKVAETGNTDFNLDQEHIIQKDGKTLYGGFYTQEEMKAFIRYAANKHVEVIPEIDVPGHMMAAIRVYPELTCDTGLNPANSFSKPICLCKENVLEFAKNVFTEIAALFPSKYIHIGGDEVEKSSWEKSPIAQEFMKAKGFQNMDQVQSYFTDYMKKFFESKGKTLIGWDEIIDGGIDSSAVVMFWRPWAKDAPYNGTKNHNKVVMSPDGPLYFDAVPDNHGLPAVYKYDPFDATYRLDNEQQGRILGVQANLWSEMVPSEKRADYLTMPRMTALAELGWTHKQLYESYLQRYNAHYERLDNLKINYQLPFLNNLVGNNVFVGKTSFFTASPLSRFIIHYTIDGTLPTMSSAILSQPVDIDHSLVLKLALFTPDGRRGDLYTLNFESQQYAPADNPGNLAEGLNAGFYKGQFNKTTNIKATADSLFRSDLIGVPKSVAVPAFGLKFNGYIDVPSNGVYTFYLNCDDGGLLRIGDKVTVDNDGLHSEREKGGEVALMKGLHKFSLDFIQGGGGYLLDLKYSINNSEPKNIPASWLKAPAN